MNRLQLILNQYSFTEETIKRAKSKKTEAGAIKELSTFHSFKEVFPDDETVFLKAFESMRYNANDTCLCGAKIGRNYQRVEKRKFKCPHCKKRINALANTPLRGMHFDLGKFINLAYWTFHNKKGYTAAGISRFFNWKYDTALNLRHRMNDWMGLAIKKMEFLPDIPIEVDEVFPPIPSGLPKGIGLSRGLGSEAIDSHLVMSQRGGLTKVEHLEEVKSEIIQPIFHSSIAAGSLIYSDGKTVYNFLATDEKKYQHKACNHAKKQWADGDVHVNTAEAYNGQAKNQIKYVHNGVSEKHVTGYMEDAAWSFSHRFCDVYEAIENLFNALPALNEITKYSKKLKK